MQYRTFFSTLLAGLAFAGATNAADAPYPRVIAAPGGEIIIPDAESQAS